MSNFDKAFDGFVYPLRVLGRVALLTKLSVTVPVKLAFRLFQGRPEPRNTHGDAKWAEVPDLRARGFTRPNGGFVLGVMPFQNRYGSRRVVKSYAHPEASVMVLGARGSGKSNLMKANLLALKDWPYKAKPDVIVVDAVGELQRDYGPFLARLGYNVRCFNLHDGSGSLCYDPLSTLQLGSKSYDADLRNLCILLLPDASEIRNNHFVVLPRRLLAGSITYHLTCEPEKATLDYCLQAIVKPLKELQAQTEKWSVLLHDPSIANAITVSKVVADREFSGFITTMTDKFDSFLMPVWRSLTQPGRDSKWIPLRGWTYREMYRDPRPTILFIRTGLDGEINGPCVRLMIGNAANERKNMLLEEGAGSFPKHLLVMVDEARNMGNCEAVLKIQNEQRKAKVNMMLAYLSKSDVFQIFPSAKTLLEGFTFVIPGGSNDLETLEWASRMCGQKTAMAYSESQGRGGGGSSEHEAGVRLIQPDQIKRIGADKWLVLNHGGLEYVADKPWWFKKRWFKADVLRFSYKNLTR